MKKIVLILMMSFIAPLIQGSRNSLVNESTALKKELEVIKQKYGLPSIAAVIVNKDGINEVAATGKRAFDHLYKVTIYDKYHIGSNTKSMTAMLFTKEVESGNFSWESRIEDVFPGYIIHEKLVKVTLESLLRHKAGITNNTVKLYPNLWKKFIQMQGIIPAKEQGIILARKVLSDAPMFEPNNKSNYSNAGISLVGHALELTLKSEYEKLMKENLFDILGMDSCDFGTAGSTSSADQPRGHLYYEGKLYSIPPTVIADNPDAIAPAGKVHCSVIDWGKYIVNHLKGSRSGTPFLSKNSYNKLHSPLKDDTYGLGWLRLKAPWDKNKKVFFHNGSNTMNYAEMWFSSEDNIGIGVVTNIGNEEAREAFESEF